MKEILKGLIIGLLIGFVFNWVATSTMFIKNVEKGEEGYLITMDIMDTTQKYYYEF